MKDVYIEIESVPCKMLLAEECWNCGGDGHSLSEKWDVCRICHGKGTIITANGKAILALLVLKKQA